MSAISSRKSDSYGKDSFDEDLTDNMIEAEELDLDNDSIFEDNEIIAAALDFYDSNFKLNALLNNNDKRKDSKNDEENENEDEEEDDDLKKMTDFELPEMNFDNIDLEPKSDRKIIEKKSIEMSLTCEEINDPDNEEELHNSDNDQDDNEALASNRSKPNNTDLDNNNIEIEISSRRPSSFDSDARYSFSFEEKESSTSIPRKANSRLNLSFSNDRVREIERHNKILLQKILTKKPTIEAKNGEPKKKPNSTIKNKSANEAFLFNRQASAAINRKKEQNKIDYENQILKRKLEAIALGKRKKRLS